MFERNTNQRESICNSKRRKENSNYLNVCVNDERKRERERMLEKVIALFIDVSVHISATLAAVKKASINC